MEYDSLRDASHTPPADYDWEASGPWCCSWCQCTVWHSAVEFVAAVASLAVLKAKVDGGYIESKKLYDTQMKQHSDAHGDQVLFEPPILHGQSTKIFVVDPLHALLLNISKTAWKYSFGDRMSDQQRERVAAYLLGIGVFLDIRPKGKRNPEQKWFSGSQFDEFVLGALMRRKSKSPGLVENILALSSSSYSTCLPWPQQLRRQLKQAKLESALPQMRLPPRRLKHPRVRLASRVRQLVALVLHRQLNFGLPWRTVTIAS